MERSRCMDCIHEGKDYCDEPCISCDDDYSDFTPKKEENKMDDKLKAFVDAMVTVTEDGKFVVGDYKYTVMTREEVKALLEKELSNLDIQKNIVRQRNKFIKDYIKVGYTPEDLDAFKDVKTGDPLLNVMVKMVSFKGIVEAVLDDKINFWEIRDYVMGEGQYIYFKNGVYIFSEENY